MISLYHAMAQMTKLLYVLMDFSCFKELVFKVVELATLKINNQILVILVYLLAFNVISLVQSTVQFAKLL